MLYYGATVFACFFYLYFAISGGGAQNGIMKMIKLRQCGKTNKLNFCLALCSFEMFLWVLALTLSLMNAWKTNKVYGKYEVIFQKETEVQKLERKGEENQA